MEKFSGPLARRYGTALFNSLSELFKNNAADFENATEKIRLLSEYFHKKIITLFNNQSLSMEQKKQLLDTFLKKVFIHNNAKFYEHVSNFLTTILENNRISLIHPIFNFFLKKSDEHLGIVRVNFVSAHEVSKEVANKFENTIAKTLKKRVSFSSSVDESLRSGFLIKIGNKNIDASLKSLLNKLKASIK